MNSSCLSQSWDPVFTSRQFPTCCFSWKGAGLGSKRKNIFYISILTCIYSGCNFCHRHPTVVLVLLRGSAGSLFPWAASATTTILVTWGIFCNVASHWQHRQAWFSWSSFIQCRYILSQKPVREALRCPNISSVTPMGNWSLTNILVRLTNTAHY